MHADVRGVRLAKDLHRVAPLVVLAVREDDDHLIAPIAPQPTLLRIAVGGGREQMVRQCQPVANRGHPFSAEQLIVNEIDVTDHVLVIERERADHIRVVGEDDERNPIVAPRCDERFDRILRRRQPRLHRLHRRCRIARAEREILERPWRADAPHLLQHARRQIERDDNVEPARRDLGLRVRQHRLHHGDAEKKQRDREQG